MAHQIKISRDPGQIQDIGPDNQTTVYGESIDCQVKKISRGFNLVPKIGIEFAVLRHECMITGMCACVHVFASACMCMLV